MNAKQLPEKGWMVFRHRQTLGHQRPEHVLVAQPCDAFVVFQHLVPGDVMELSQPETTLKQHPCLIRFPQAHAGEVFLHGRVFRIKVVSGKVELAVGLAGPCQQGRGGGEFRTEDAFESQFVAFGLQFAIAGDGVVIRQRQRPIALIFGDPGQLLGRKLPIRMGGVGM